VRFRIHHPTIANRIARYGWLAPRGFWIDVIDEGKIVATYDASSDAYDHRRPLNACLELFVERGFFSADDLESALYAMSEREPEQLRGNVRRAARAVMNFKKAAD